MTEQPPTFNISFGKKIRNYFLAGLLVTMPIFVSLTVAWWFVEFVDDYILTLFPDEYNPQLLLTEIGSPIGAPGIGVIILLIFITLVGWMAANFLGRSLINLGEWILNKMPVIRVIYQGSKQIIETVLRDQANAFRQVVLIEYPRKGLYAIAFVTSDSEGEIATHFDRPHVNVFLPTTPNPTSGFLLFVPQDEVIFLDMAIEDGIKLVISAGMITPDSVKENVTETTETK